MTKEELRKSLDFVNEEREKLQKECERKDNIIKELNKDLEYYKHEEELYRYYQQENPRLMNNWNELKEFILNHYIVGHTVQNGSLDMIINKMKELENEYK